MASLNGTAMKKGGLMSWTPFSREIPLNNDKIEVKKDDEPPKKGIFVELFRESPVVHIDGVDYIGSFTHWRRIHG